MDVFNRKINDNQNKQKDKTEKLLIENTFDIYCKFNK